MIRGLSLAEREFQWRLDHRHLHHKDLHHLFEWPGWFNLQIKICLIAIYLRWYRSKSEPEEAHRRMRNRILRRWWPVCGSFAVYRLLECLQTVDIILNNRKLLCSISCCLSPTHNLSSPAHCCHECSGCCLFSYSTRKDNGGHCAIGEVQRWVQLF